MELIKDFFERSNKFQQRLVHCWPRRTTQNLHDKDCFAAKRHRPTLRVAWDRGHQIRPKSRASQRLDEAARVRRLVEPRQLREARVAAREDFGPRRVVQSRRSESAAYARDRRHACRHEEGHRKLKREQRRRHQATAPEAAKPRRARWATAPEAAKPRRARW